MKHKSLVSVLFFLLIFLAFESKAQKEEKIPEPSRFNFKLNVAIPTVSGNKAFRNSFRGIYDATANLQLRLFNGVYLGAQGNYTGFKISNDKIANINTECRIANGGINLGFEKFSSPRLAWYVNFAAGYNWINYYKVELKDSITPNTHFLAWSYKPSAGFSYYSDDNFSLGLFAAYTILTNEFNPRDINLQKFSSYGRNDANGLTNYFSIGIVLNFNIRKELFQESGSSADDEEDN